LKTVARPTMWFVDTDMASFYKFDETTPYLRAGGDTSAFKHWLDAKCLFVTPAESPEQYANNLEEMAPGELVFAYEKEAGFVAIGTVAYPKNLQKRDGAGKLYPNPDQIVRSLAVDWDTAVTRTKREVSAVAPVSGPALRRVNPGKQLFHILESMLDERVRSAQDIDESTVVERIAANPAYSAVMRQQIALARIGQGSFREAVLARGHACRLTGINDSQHLVASHIKPWRVCADGQHHDGANGLMLAPHIDHLFDGGWISFTDEGSLLCAKNLDIALLHAWHIDPEIRTAPFEDDQIYYLNYHRLHVFESRELLYSRHIADRASLLTDIDH